MKHFGTTTRRLVLGAVACALLALVPLFVLGAGSHAGKQKVHVAQPARAADLDAPGSPGGESSVLNKLERYWQSRVTYPTGRFDARWLVNAAGEAAKVQAGIPAGSKPARSTARANTPSLSTTSFTSYGPQPQITDQCQAPCFTFPPVSGRVNVIAVDPTTTTPGSVVAYFGSDGGGVWKSTNCCLPTTTWSQTDSNLPAAANTTVDDITLDPNHHNTLYAGTGDLTFGSFSFGSVGVLKSTDAGATWQLKGASTFSVPYPPASTSFPQYQSIGKVRVDPNNSNTVIAGTKTGLYFSYDAGDTWNGPCVTNSFTSQRQDITSILTRNMAGTTRLYVAVGTRGYGTTVQPDLGHNGANGIYIGDIPASLPGSGCPTISWSLSSQPAINYPVSGWPSGTGGGVGCNPPIPPDTTTLCPVGSNTVGRIDLAAAPQDPNIIYAEVQAVDPQSCTPLSILGDAQNRGCFLGLWKTTNGGSTWTRMSTGATLNTDGGGGVCGEDTTQNWYNQALVVDPGDPTGNTIFMDAIDPWKSVDGGASWTDVNCGYQAGLLKAAMHVDQHALAYAPPVAGHYTTLLAGNDGGIWVATNADQAAVQPTAGLPAIPTFTSLNATVNDIEFYSGDISANFATAPTQTVVAGAQDNGSSSLVTANPPGAATPLPWNERTGGDGTGSRLEPNQGLRVYMQTPGGGLLISRTGVGGPYQNPPLMEILQGTDWPWANDHPSFVFPYDLDKHYCGGNAGSPAATCDHIIAGAAHPYETITGGFDNTGLTATTASWHQNGPDLTKQTLADRSFINQIHYAYLTNTIAIAGTNDGNVQFGFGLGQAAPNSASWVNVTGGNAVLPNRPILDAIISPNPADNSRVGYASVGGFNANTPSTPGHVFRVSCTGDCASFTWQDKTGNLPDIPADSIAVNPHVPNQVFVGTDWGLYFTNDISVASPTWFHFTAGVPNTMIWDMTIDQGDTTLALFTRSHGMLAWALPLTNLPTAVRLVSFTASPAAKGIAIGWRTASERDTAGYVVWRYAKGARVKVNRTLVAAKTSGIGAASYRVVDRTARPGVAYTYRLQSVGLDGRRSWRATATVRAR
jgi:hypothetical protein